MISIDDIIGMTDLTEEEVAAIGEHEHLEPVQAAGLAALLMDRPGGPAAVRRMISEDIRAALARGDRSHARELLAALRHFLHEHPDARASNATT